MDPINNNIGSLNPEIVDSTPLSRTEGSLSPLASVALSASGQAINTSHSSPLAPPSNHSLPSFDYTPYATQETYRYQDVILSEGREFCHDTILRVKHLSPLVLSRLNVLSHEEHTQNL